MTSKSRRLYFRGLCLFACVLCAFTGYNAFQQSTELESPITDHAEGSRHLLNAVEIIPGFQGNVCDAGWETALGGALASIIYILLSVYLFLGVAIICDGGFVFSLELICSPFGLNLSPDVAGATFMAAGSSAPELATSFIGVFLSDSDVGIGTILGSAVFNILIIIGATAILSGRTLDLDYRPIVRDNFFYLGSVVILVGCIIPDDQIDWYDNVMLLTWYTLYIIFLAFNESIMNKLAPHDEQQGDDEMSEQVEMKDDNHAHKCLKEDNAIFDEENGTADSPEANAIANIGMGSVEEDPDECVDKNGAEAEEEDEEEGGCLDTFLDIMSWPYEKAFEYTIPNCEYEDIDELDDLSAEEIAELAKDLTCGQRWYWAAFFISLIWITILSYFMVELMLKLGCIWGIPDVVMGLTFLAMGTSIPDALGSISVAKDGHGDMAVSNAVGSNVFDICMGLGLPWAIQAASNGGDPRLICDTSDIVPSIFILLGIIFVLFGVLWVGKWRLVPSSGYILFATYGAFVIYSLVSTAVKTTKDCSAEHA